MSVRKEVRKWIEKSSHGFFIQNRHNGGYAVNCVRDTRIGTRKEINYENLIQLIKIFGGNDTNTKNTEKGKTAVLSDTAVKVVGKMEFIVKRHFTGQKNIDEVLTRIAVSKAYEDIRNGLLYKNSENYLSQDLAKREAI